METYNVQFSSVTDSLSKPINCGSDVNITGVEDAIYNQEIKFRLYLKKYYERTSDIFEVSDSDSADKLTLERFELHKLIFNNGTEQPRKQENSQKIAKKNRLLAMINDCYFESGIWTEADDYFENLIKADKDKHESLDLLSDIVNHNLRDDHVLEGVLHILSNYAYEDIDPYGITIALACTVNHSPVIQDLLISCFEKWGSPDSIDILEGMKLEQEWLIDYKNEVLTYLRSQNDGVSA